MEILSARWTCAPGVHICVLYMRWMFHHALCMRRELLAMVRAAHLCVSSSLSEVWAWPVWTAWTA